MSSPGGPCVRLYPTSSPLRAAHNMCAWPPKSRWEGARAPTGPQEELDDCPALPVGKRCRKDLNTGVDSLKPAFLPYRILCPHSGATPPPGGSCSALSGASGTGLAGPVTSGLNHGPGGRNCHQSLQACTVSQLSPLDCRSSVERMKNQKPGDKKGSFNLANQVSIRPGGAEVYGGY